MNYSPKHLNRRCIGICLIGVITCTGFILTHNVPGGEPISEAKSSAELITLSEDVSVAPETTSVIITPKVIITSEPELEPTPEPEPEPIPEPEPLYTEEDLTAMVLTLAGECYDDETQDKYNVAWTIINRICDGRFGSDTVLEVVSSPHQFSGYWHQSRSVSVSDYLVAEEVLTAYYTGEAAPVDYLYFSSGGGTTNIFS